MRSSGFSARRACPAERGDGRRLEENAKRLLLTPLGESAPGRSCHRPLKKSRPRPPARPTPLRSVPFRSSKQRRDLPLYEGYSVQDHHFRRTPLRAAAFAAVALLAFVACRKPGEAPPGLLPAVRSFLQEVDHGFGPAIFAGAAPNWAKGPRQVVSFASGQTLLFYIDGDKVVSVYEQGAGGRRKVWGD